MQFFAYGVLAPGATHKKWIRINTATARLCVYRRAVCAPEPLIDGFCGLYRQHRFENQRRRRLDDVQVLHT